MTPDLAAGTYYWSARAVDEFGAASEWAPAWSFDVASDTGDPDTGNDTGDGIDTGGNVDTGAFAKGGSCGCAYGSGSGSAPGGVAGMLGLLGFALIKRRRG